MASGVVPAAREQRARSARSAEERFEEFADRVADRVTDRVGELSERAGEMTDQFSDQFTDQFTDRVVEPLRDAAGAIRPKLRGWLHAALAPLALAAGIVLVVLAPNGTARTSAAVFGLSAVLLFGVSALYNTRGGQWSERVEVALKRFDHANIFVLIAGSYTPFLVLLLEGSTRTVMLTSVWVGAVAGIVFKVVWPFAPRWLGTPIYIGLGWACLFVMPDLAAASNAAVIALLATGGALYTVGGVIYALRRPNPFPSWFGFHEVFHACTVLAFISHYVAVSLITYTA